MVKLTQSLEHWLMLNHPDIIPLLMFGHVELFTPEMQEEYIHWCYSAVGQDYLKGGK